MRSHVLISTILDRLEAATSRLEDIAVLQASVADVRSLETGVANVAPVAGAAEPPRIAPTPAAVIEEPPSVVAFDEGVGGQLKIFLQLSEQLSPVLKEQADHVATLFKLQRDLVLQAAVCTKPSDAFLQKLLTPFGNEINAITEIKDSNRSNRDFFNHLSTIADGIPAVGWVTVVPKPAPYINEMKNAAQFYANRVVKEFKEKDKKHVEWTRSFDSLLEALRKYVLEQHTTGLTWDPKGQNPETYSPVSSTSVSSPIVGSPPPPPPLPPPPPPPPLAVEAVSPLPAAAGTAAVLAELNKGSEVTKGLRKVPKEEMTHKNPSLRASSVVPAASSGPGGKKPARPVKPSALAGKKPSKFELEGTKWAVEYFEGDKNLVIDQAAINHSVSIYGCKNTTIQIKGKVNGITIVNCTKTAVLVENVISSISIMASPSFVLQILGKAPTIQLDSTDSGQIYLSRDCLDVEITTAKCSSINISLPEEGEEEGVFVEKAMPEMLRTVIKDGQLVTSVVELSS